MDDTKQLLQFLKWLGTSILFYVCWSDSVHWNADRRYKCHDYILCNEEQFVFKCISDDIIHIVQPKDRQIQEACVWLI